MTKLILDNLKISIIIPCYNTHKHMPVTIKSISNQTKKPHEIIVVNDGSDNPETVKYLNSLTSEDILILNTENQGLSAARNFGIKNATGDAILPLDSDDWLQKNALEKLAYELAASRNESFCFSDINLCGSKTGLLEKKYNPFEQLFFNNIPYSILYRKSSWEKIGGYDTSMKNGYEDWDFNIKLILSGISGLKIDQAVLNYRVSSDGMLLSHSTNFHGELWNHIINKHKNIYNLRGLIKNWLLFKSIDSNRPLFLYFFWFFLFKTLPKKNFNGLFHLLKIFKDSNKKKHKKS